MPKKPAVDAQDELESKVKLLCDQAKNHIKGREYGRALSGYNKALDLNANDINALVARSRCYLLLGEPMKALHDSETALSIDKNNIRATYQKAESLYFLGQFEQSLMFFHRGLRARPELASFRLGIQKTQQAIENTIGAGQRRKSTASGTSTSCLKSSSVLIETTPKSETTLKSPRTQRRKTRTDEQDKKLRNARKLLGELCVDKEYLENLLQHPDLKRADTNTENVSIMAQEAVDFLNKRQEFWRQQRPCTALPNHKTTNPDCIPPWF